MNLYEINAADWAATFPEGHTHRVFNIAQKPDCSAFLVLVCGSVLPQAPIVTIPAGYDFTYCQAWGLTTNRESVARAINEIKGILLRSGFPWGGATWHCDPTFQSQLQAFLLAWQVGMLAPTATVAIRSFDNATVQMTRAEVTALAGALMAYVQSVYANSWAMKDAL